MKPLIHLLKPGEYRAWCRPNDVPERLTCTTLPSKVTCAVCLSVFRRETHGNRKDFKVSHIPERLQEDQP